MLLHYLFGVILWSFLSLTSQSPIPPLNVSCIYPLFSVSTPITLVPAIIISLGLLQQLPNQPSWFYSALILQMPGKVILPCFYESLSIALHLTQCKIPCTNCGIVVWVPQEIFESLIRAMKNKEDSWRKSAGSTTSSWENKCYSSVGKSGWYITRSPVAQNSGPCPRLKHLPSLTLQAYWPSVCQFLGNSNPLLSQDLCTVLCLECSSPALHLAGTLSLSLQVSA